jgi:transposase
MPRARKYPVELLDRATRLVFESGRPIAHVAADLGLPSETLRKYVRQVEANEGRRPDLPTSEEREEIRELRREMFELRRANEILKARPCFSRASSIHTVRGERQRFAASEAACWSSSACTSAACQPRVGEGPAACRRGGRGIGRNAKTPSAQTGSSLPAAICY